MLGLVEAGLLFLIGNTDAHDVVHDLRDGVGHDEREDHDRHDGDQLADDESSITEEGAIDAPDAGVRKKPSNTPPTMPPTMWMPTTSRLSS